MKLRDLASKRNDLFMIDPRLLKIKEGWNARVPGDELASHVDMLKTSIKEIGVSQPLTIVLEGDDVFVTDGHCRLAAVMLAIAEGTDIKAVPCRPEERYASEADRVLSMITRNSGKALTMLEQSNVVKRLAAFGWDSKQIAGKTGYSGQHIENLLRLSGAPEELKGQVAAGHVSASSAVALLRKHGGGAPAVVADAVKKTGKRYTNKSGKRAEPKPQGSEVKGAMAAAFLRPNVVCLCGSCRFREEYEQANRVETLAGNIVLSGGVFMGPEEQALEPDVKKRLDALHLRKIDIADEVLILNVGGYIGESTREEIEYAKKNFKSVRYLEQVQAEGGDK
jgi:ParB-like chromosome segregation protein Spo0J